MKIEPGRWYSKEEIAKFRNDPDLGDMVMRGFVLQQDPHRGRMRFVHWSNAAMDQGKPGNTWGAEKETVFDKTTLPPITKRTPQQRVESLMSKVGDDLHFLLSGEAGHEVTGEQVRQVAEDVLQTAEDQFAEEERKKIVRTTGSQFA